MDKRTNTLRRMASAVQQVILYYAAVWAGYLPFETCNTKFDDITDDIDLNADIKQQLTKGYTLEKDLKRKKMANIVSIISKKIGAWATARGDVALAKLMKINNSRLLYGRATRSLYFGEQVVNALKDMPAADKTAYAITAADETLLQTSVENFRTVMTLPREITVNKKTATKKLKELLASMENLLKNEMDGLMMNYEGTEFFEKYFNARIIVDQVRHTVIKGNVTDPAGVDLNKVFVKLIGKEKETGNEVVVFEEMTNKDGNFVKSALNPELSWDVEFTIPNYVPQKISDIDLERGAIDRLDVVLVPVV